MFIFHCPSLFIHQKNTCILPEDLRDFYLTTDGFTLTWSVKLDSKFYVRLYLVLYNVRLLKIYIYVLCFIEITTNESSS